MIPGITSPVVEPDVGMFGIDVVGGGVVVDVDVVVSGRVVVVVVVVVGRVVVVVAGSVVVLVVVTGGVPGTTCRMSPIRSPLASETDVAFGRRSRHESVVLCAAAILEYVSPCLATT